MPTATTDINEQIAEAKTAIKSLLDANDEMHQSFKHEEHDGKQIIVVDPDVQTKFAKNLGTIQEQRRVLEMLEATVEGKAFMDRPAGQAVGPYVDAAQLVAQLKGESATKTIGELFVASAEFQALGTKPNVDVSIVKMDAPFRLKARDICAKMLMGTQNGEHGFKDVYTSLPGTNPYGGFGTVQREAMIIAPMRPGRVRDLYVGAQRTNARVIEFFRETGFTNHASPVPERSGGTFALKPQSGLSFDYMSTTTKTIAHWEAAHRNVLADTPQLEDLINTRLLYGLQLEEDAQLLYGDGTGENLLGILADSDIQTYNWSAGATLPVVDNMADALRRALTLTTLALFPATGIVVHPSDWEKIELTKNTIGDYLLATSIAVGGQMRVWQTPVVTSFAISPGTALVGAFGLGAQLYDREDATIRTADQHADFFLRNAVVILAEERLAQTIARPQAFVKVTFDHHP